MSSGTDATCAPDLRRGGQPNQRLHPSAAAGRAYTGPEGEGFDIAPGLDLAHYATWSAETFRGVNSGTVDRLEYRNSDDVERKYQAMQFMGRHDLRTNLYVNGHHAVQIKNEGNFEGEAANQPANPSDFGDWPGQLGLKLDSTRAPVDVLVVDRVEKPSEN